MKPNHIWLLMQLQTFWACRIYRWCRTLIDYMWSVLRETLTWMQCSSWQSDSCPLHTEGDPVTMTGKSPTVASGHVHNRVDKTSVPKRESRSLRLKERVSAVLLNFINVSCGVNLREIRGITFKNKRQEGTHRLCATHEQHWPTMLANYIHVKSCYSGCHFQIMAWYAVGMKAGTR